MPRHATIHACQTYPESASHASSSQSPSAPSTASSPPTSHGSHGTISSLASASRSTRLAPSPTSSTTAPARAAGRRPTSASSSGAATGWRRSRRGARPTGCSAWSPWARTRRRRAPGVGACRPSGRPSSSTWRPIPSAGRARPRTTAIGSSGLSRTGSAVLSTPSRAATWRIDSTVLPRKAYPSGSGSPTCCTGHLGGGIRHGRSSFRVSMGCP